MTLWLARLLRESSVLMSGNLGVAVLGFGKSILIARELGPTGYGVWGVVVGLTSLSSRFLGFRTEEPLTKALVEARGAEPSRTALVVSAALSADLSTRAASFLFLFLSAPWVAENIAGGPDAIPVYRVYAWTALFSFVDALWFSVCRDQRRFGVLAGVPLLLNALQLAGVALLWQLGRLDLLSLALLSTGTTVAVATQKTYTVMSLLAHRYAVSLSRLRADASIWYSSEIRDFWHFMRATYWSSMISELVKQGDVLILGYYRGEAEVGFYKLAKSLVAIVRQVVDSISTVVYQDFNELLREARPERLWQGIRQLVTRSLPVVLFFTAIGWGVAGFAIATVFGQSFAPAILMFRLQLLGVAAIGVLFWFHPALLALGLYEYKLRATAVTFLCGLPLMAVLASAGGGVALSVMVSALWVVLFSLFGIGVARRVTEPPRRRRK